MYIIFVGIETARNGFVPKRTILKRIGAEGKFIGMDCQETCNNIPLFIEDKLTGDELSAFLLHVKSCKSCYEEMETSYLLREALSRLEQGESFNIHEELLKKFRIYEKLAGLHNVFQLARRVILLIAAFSVGICMLGLYV